MPAAKDPKELFFSAWTASCSSGTLVKSVCSRPLAGSAAEPREPQPSKVVLRPIDTKTGTRISVLRTFATQDKSETLPVSEADALLHVLVGTFRSVNLFTTEASYSLEDRGGRWFFQKSAPVHRETNTSHDRKKSALLDPSSRWMIALGIASEDGRIKKGMEAKHRQIERFVELLGHLLESDLPRTDPLRIVDMGCGKGYLTFAVYEWLVSQGAVVQVTGIERRKDLVDVCNRVASECGFAGLHFEQGDIGDKPLPAVDGVIALHACDTATDDALANGVLAGASWLVVSPCCHKQCRPQLRPPPGLEHAWKHGILLEREAEIATDALRAEILEAAGFQTKVFEFISTEHTSKNLMITAKRKGAPLEGDPLPLQLKPGLVRSAQALAAHYGITSQRLAERLALQLLPRSDS